MNLLAHLSRHATNVGTLTVVMALLLAACGWQPSTTESEDSALTVESGGLGLSRSEWEDRIGPIQKVDASSGISHIVGVDATSGFSHIVGVDQSAFVDFTSGLVRLIQIHVDGRRTSESQARDLALPLLLRDAIRTRDPSVCRGCPVRLVTDFFSSGNLARVGGACPRNIDAQPGDIVISTQFSKEEHAVPVLVTISWRCGKTIQPLKP